MHGIGGEREIGEDDSSDRTVLQIRAYGTGGTASQAPALDYFKINRFEEHVTKCYYSVSVNQ